MQTRLLICGVSKGARFKRRQAGSSPGLAFRCSAVLHHVKQGSNEQRGKHMSLVFHLDPELVHMALVIFVLLLLTVCIVVLFFVGCEIGRTEERLRNISRDE